MAKQLQNTFSEIRTIQWQEPKLLLLDQRYLPDKEQYYSCESVTSVIKAIKDMVVRGAPAIGITAAYGVLISVTSNDQSDSEAYRLNVLSDMNALEMSRPTAVNLCWAISVMKDLFLAEIRSPNLAKIMYLKANEIHDDDISNNIKMGQLACHELRNATEAVHTKFSVITHCNAGALATGGYGTALGAIRAAWSQNLISKVYADETRPWLQGSRLTAWELQKDGIPVCLNVDNASSWLMENKNIKWVIVGSDRIAANGDVANKIGTFNLAIIAKYHNVKVMVVAPSNTIDMSIGNGSGIAIEMRSGSELKKLHNHDLAPQQVEAINPVFDVTPANLIDVIVTELGVVRKPNAVKMKTLFEKTNYESI